MPQPPARRGTAEPGAGLFSSLAATPAVVGALTILVVIVATYLAYNANTGLPFVPVYRVSVEVPNAARLTGSNEVRIGGHRVGVVESMSAVPGGGGGAQGTGGEGAPAGGAVARLDLKLDRAASPLPRDSIFRVRYLSTFGLKYVEVVRGAGPPAPAGFVFDGTDDSGACGLPGEGRRFAAETPPSARNGCFQPQAEFDDLANVLDRRAREQLRTTLVGFGGALAGRGASLGGAVRAAVPLLDDLAPVARTLSAPATGLERLIEAMSRAAAATAPVAGSLAGLFSNSAIAFEAISRDPGALAAAISEAAPLTERGPGQLRRQSTLLAASAELARRLGPGARLLPGTAPALRAAIEAAAPPLARVPDTGPDLEAALAELRELVVQPATLVTLRRLRETFAEAGPLAAHVAPAQTVCNYAGYFLTFLPEHLSLRSTIGFTQRNAIVVPYPPDPGPVSIGGTVVDFPAYARAPITGYSGAPADGLAGALPDPADDGLFKPRELPIGHGPINSPVGQLTPEYPDCAAGQLGYPLGRLRVPGQPRFVPGIGVGDYPGSLGPTTLFYDRDGSRELRDTRVPSRAPTTWGIEP